MKKLALILALLMCRALHAQPPNPSIIMVSASPSGTCSASLPWQYNYTAGTGWYCGSVSGGTGTWTQVGSSTGGSGTVTSVALVGSNTLFSSTAGTAVTTSGTLNLDSQLYSQSANCVVAGPASGSAAKPTCRSLVLFDLPTDTGQAFWNVKAFGATGNGTTDDASAINTLISTTLPQAAFNTQAGVITAPYGVIYFPAGTYHIGTRITVPAGSHIKFEGVGRCYQDTNTGPTTVAGLGCTLLASTDANGVLYLPDTSVPGDSTVFVARDMDFRLDGTQTSTGKAVDLTGMSSGGMQNVGVINDPNTSTITNQAGWGLYANFGALGNTTFLRDIDVGAFGSTTTGASNSFTMYLGGNHVSADNIHLRGASLASQALYLAPQGGDRFELGAFHIFAYGNSTTGVELIYLNPGTANIQTFSFASLGLEDIVVPTGQTSNLIQQTGSFNSVIEIDRLNLGCALSTNLKYLFAGNMANYFSVKSINGYPSSNTNCPNNTLNNYLNAYKVDNGISMSLPGNALPDTALVRTAAGTVSVTTTPIAGAVTANGTFNASTIGTSLILPQVLYSAAGTALPTCNTAAKGEKAVVSDATSPTYNATYTPGGAVVASVICSGSSWVTQ